MRLVVGLIACSVLRLGVMEAQRPAPQAVAAAAGRYVPLQTMRAGRVKMPAALARRVTIRYQATLIQNVLLDIANQAGLGLSYSDEVVRSATRVSIEAANMPAAEVLTRVVEGTPWAVLVTPQAQIAVVEAPPQPTGAIAGLVTDGATGAAIPAADVSLERTSWRTTTDKAGHYRLSGVDTGSYILTVRLFGYAKRSRPVTVREGATDTVDVALEPVVTRLDEVVSTATGHRRKLELGNDITTINADSVMRTQPVSSMTQLLEGRVPGLTVLHTSGAPGDPARLRLRGAGSPLQNNDPVVIIDGIRVYAAQSDNRSANLARTPGTTNLSVGDSVGPSGFAAPSPLDYIDPNSIETVEVLKGPSAATMYGQDAANGVIVITTKKGKAGPPVWTANFDHAKTKPIRYPDLLIRWGHVSVGDQPLLCPISNLTEINVAPYVCEGDSIVTFQLLNNPKYTVLDNGAKTGLTMGVSGGSSTLRYAVTVSYRDESGLFQLPDFEVDRFATTQGLGAPNWMRHPQHLKYWGATSTLTAQLGQKADLSLRTSVTRTTQRRSSLEQQLGALMVTYLDPSSETYYVPSGNFVVPSDQDFFKETYYTRVTDVATQFTNGAALNWRPRPWLTLTADAGLDVVHRDDEQYFPNLPVKTFTGSDTNGYISNGLGTSLVSTLKIGGTAHAPLGHGVQFAFGVGANYTGRGIADQTTTWRNLKSGTSLFGDTVAGLPLRRALNDATFGWYVEPAIGRGSTWLNFGFRQDGGSSYGSGVTLPTFPKLNFSYTLSDAPYFPFKDLFSLFRLRVAYGRSSRQPGTTDRLRLYSAATQIWGDGAFVPGASLSSLGNTELLPERATEIEGGFDADLLADRLHLSVTGYRKTTEDALLGVPLPPSVWSAIGTTGNQPNLNFAGPISILQNVGRVRNTGLELTLNAQLVRSALVTVGTQLQISRNRNVMVELGHGVQAYYSSGSANQGGQRIAANYPINGRWSKPILGFADANGDGVLQQSEVLIGDTAVYVGETTSPYTASLMPTVSLWRGTVQVSAGFLYDDGFAQENELVRAWAPFTAGRNVPGTPIGEQASVIDLNEPFVNGVFQKSDYNWIQTVSSLRFNSLSVQYTVPPTLARRVGAQRLSIAVQGTNLKLWSSYRGGLDPNVNDFPTGNNVTDNGVLPQPRTWQVRVNAGY